MGEWLFVGFGFLERAAWGEVVGALGQERRLLRHRSEFLIVVLGKEDAYRS